MRTLFKRIGIRSLHFVILLSLLQSCMMMGPAHMKSDSFDSNYREDNISIYDPVCGRKIDISTDQLSWEYDEKTYYFHSTECLEVFKITPDEYLYQQHHNHRHGGFLWSMGGIAMGAMMILMLF